MASLTVAARAAFAMAVDEARSLGSAATDREHLFIGALRCEAVRELKIEQLFAVAWSEHEALFAETDALTAALKRAGCDPVATRRHMRRLWGEAHPQAEVFSGHRTAECRRVFDRADTHATGSVGVATLLWALAEQPSQLIERCLEEQHVDRGRLVRALGEAAGLREGGAAAAEPERPLGPAEKYGRDLTRLARERRLKPAFGRDDEIKQVARVLMQAKKSNPILLGDAGVGKTAIVEGLAVKLAERRGPQALRKARIVELSLGALVADTGSRGEFEERLQKVIEHAESDPSLILFIDEIHMLVGAGALRGAMDAANLLKPALARGAMRVIGATTTHEYRQFIEKDSALERRFQVVWVEEPDRAKAILILKGVRKTLESHHGIEIQDGAVERAVDLAMRYLPDQRLPDKAIDLLDQACARVLLESFSNPAEGARAPARTIGPDEIAAVVAQRCRIPIEQLTEAEGQRLLRMEEVLARRVIGQDEAVAAVAQAIRSARAGLKHPKRPVGVFLFLGPTGTGKTELAKALAEFLFGDERRLIRIDMSEYQERHAVSRLVGSPPGYIGHDEGGQLTSAVRSNPYSVVLFDEVEKAHPDVYGLFLQIFDEGQLTDTHGRRADFSEAVVILTSNLGTGPAPGAKVGFMQEAPQKAAQEAIEKAVASAFRPELRNRIQKIVVFNSLARDVVARIVDKIAARTNAALAHKRIAIELSDEARAVILDRGFSTEFGARSLERAFHDLVEEPLSRLILEGRVASGGRVMVGVREKEIVLDAVPGGPGKS